jgi:two-component system alkaline phosphatase synthesis response regulator PhoP
MEHRILLVEDEENLRDAIRLNLDLEGYEVVEADNGISALKKAKEQRFNLIILDVMLPEMDGFTVCEKIRIEDTTTPILFLTAKDSSTDKVNGLRIGADDYLTKPFNLEELLLRVKVLVRHSKQTTGGVSSAKVFQFNGNEIDFGSLVAVGINKEAIPLTKKEASLLKLLTDRKNTVVSRKEILQYVWEYDVYPSTRTIDNFILSFRKYFEKDPRNPVHFHSIRGVGYKFTA